MKYTKNTITRWTRYCYKSKNDAYIGILIWKNFIENNYQIWYYNRALFYKDSDELTGKCILCL